MKRCAILWMFIITACLFEADATLKTIFFEDYCMFKDKSTIELSTLPSAVLRSFPHRKDSIDCTVILKPRFDHSVVLSIYHYYIDEKSLLTIEDTDNHKIALIGSGKFENEKKSIISEGRLTIHYQSKEAESLWNGSAMKGTAEASPMNWTAEASPMNWTAEGSSYPPFQFTFTQVRNGPCKNTEFKCGNGKCLPRSYVCSGHNRCGDNSDTKNCVIDVDGNNRLHEKVTTADLRDNTAVIWITLIAVGGFVLIILIAVYIAVLLRYNRRKSDASSGASSNAPLQSVSSTVPENQSPSNANSVSPVSGEEPPRASLYDRVRRSFRRQPPTRAEETVHQQRTESYQVPSMYPSLDPEPTAPEMNGVDNPDFKIEE